MKSMYLILLAFIFSSCLKESKTNQSTDKEKALVEKNVSYGTHTLQKLDMYLPANRSSASTKTIVLVHGGGWKEGDKVDFNSYLDSLQRRLPDWAIININYRLVSNGKNLFPAQEEDLKSALQFIYNKREAYHISDKIVLLGASAGGHMVCLQAYKYDKPVRISAVVDFFGPTDLIDFYNNPKINEVPLLMMEVTGGTPATKRDLYEKSSPLNYVTAQSPPTIILQGGADILVPARQSEMLRDKLNSLGVVNEYVFYPNENHGWGGANLTDSFNKIVGFLKENVK